MTVEENYKLWLDEQQKLGYRFSDGELTSLGAAKERLDKLQWEMKVLAKDLYKAETEYHDLMQEKLNAE